MTGPACKCTAWHSTRQHGKAGQGEAHNAVDKPQGAYCQYHGDEGAKMGTREVDEAVACFSGRKTCNKQQFVFGADLHNDGPCLRSHSITHHDMPRRMMQSAQ